MTITEVRRDEDYELMGYVRCIDEQWAALTVFGGLLSVHPTEDEARDTVETSGLSSMAESWWVKTDGRWWPCRLQEASPSGARVWITAHDYPEASRLLQLDHPTGDVLRLNEPTDS
jgi:hypothetical protein